jgi:hypothetical protein
MRDELAVVEREAAQEHDVVNLFRAGVYRATLALADDELERSERLALAANTLGQRLAIDGSAFLGTQRVMVAIASGRAASVLDSLAAIADKQPGPSTRVLFAWALLEAGEEARSAALLREIADRELGSLRRFPMFVANAAVLARAAARLAGRDLVPALEEILRPERGRNAVRGIAPVHGPDSHALALCAVARGDRSEAALAFDEARAQAGRAGAVRWLAEVERDRRALLG